MNITIKQAQEVIKILKKDKQETFSSHEFIGTYIKL